MSIIRSQLVGVLICFAVSGYGQNKIAVQSGGTVTYFDQGSLQAALDAAQNGDVVYLPGGTFSSGVPFTLSKSIQLIGTGYFPDSSAATTPTTVNGQVYLTSNASGSYITGISFTSTVSCPSNTFPTISNLVIHRCWMQGGFGSSGNNSIGSNSNSIIFSECVLGAVYLNNAINCILRNSILTVNISDARNASIQSSIFLHNSSSVIAACANCTLQGNIFMGVSAGILGAPTSYSSAFNNCFVNTTPWLTYTTAYDNVDGANAAQMFVNYTIGYDPNDDFHLTLNSAAAAVGPGGMDCGIYGGLSPWKPGGVPYNPHIQQQFIGTATDQRGVLPVQIKVGAQGN